MYKKLFDFVESKKDKDKNEPGTIFSIYDINKLTDFSATLFLCKFCCYFVINTSLL